MSLPAPHPNTVFHSCIADAVRRSATLMEQLIAATHDALARTAARTDGHDSGQHPLIRDSLRLLDQHQAALVKAYPTALSGLWVQGQSRDIQGRTAAGTGPEMAEFSLVDEDEMQAQVELAKVQQSTLHATEAVLAELDSLVSAAQGLAGVQPERNPLRPESYVRALLQVLGDTGVAADIRQVWMQQMRDLLGTLLAQEYGHSARNLRAHGVQPVGYTMPGVLADPAGGAAPQDTATPGAEEDARHWIPAGTDPHAAAAPPVSMPVHLAEPADPTADVLEDMARLEQLLAQLASGTGPAPPPTDLPTLPLSGLPGLASDLGSATGPDAPAVPVKAAGTALIVLERMLEHITHDAHLLPPVQQAIKSLEPALRQLVQHDEGFFTDDAHPARRLLDELTQRSLAYATETAPGFSGFMHLMTEAARHLSASAIRDAGPFDAVLKALESAWDAQEQTLRAQRQALEQAGHHGLLAKKIAADIRDLPGQEQLPADILDFATGPWAEVVAQAQLAQGDEGRGADPEGYLALVPVLLWSAQPDLTRQDPERLNKIIPGLLAKLRKGLKSIDYPTPRISALLQRLVGLQQSTFEKKSPAKAQEAEAATAEPQDSAPTPDAPDPHADFVVGAWVELFSNGSVVHTRLTWVSPNGTLFLFTAPDASTRSMTRRMRDKLVAEGLLRVLPAPPATAPSTKAR